MRLEELMIYRLSMELGEEIWIIVMIWDFFAKDTLGKQLVRAMDSVASNLAEGFGRYHFKESINFSYYARGSLYETKTWVTKAFHRKLLTEEKCTEFMQKLDEIGIKLNKYIQTIGKTYHQSVTNG